MIANKFQELVRDCDAIIFDYGGVFVDIEYDAPAAAFERLGARRDFKKIFSKASQLEMFNLLETGGISPEGFLNDLAAALELGEIDLKEVEQAWCSMLKKVHPARVDFVRGLSKEKRLFMLSNINEIHEKRLEKILASDSRTSDLYQCFEKVYFSHRIGVRKPQARAFQIAIGENSLDPAKTFFIDDSIQHVKAAAAAGLKSFHLDPPNSFIARV